MPTAKLPLDQLIWLRIVPGSWMNGDATFGVAFLSAEGKGVYCDVFYGSVEKLHKDSDVSIPPILGYVMAHEIGHLLLGTHAPFSSRNHVAPVARKRVAQVDDGYIAFHATAGSSSPREVPLREPPMNGD